MPLIGRASASGSRQASREISARLATRLICFFSCARSTLSRPFADPPHNSSSPTSLATDPCLAVMVNPPRPSLSAPASIAAAEMRRSASMNCRSGRLKGKGAAPSGVGLLACARLGAAEIGIEHQAIEGERSFHARPRLRRGERKQADRLVAVEREGAVVEGERRSGKMERCPPPRTPSNCRRPECGCRSI